MNLDSDVFVYVSQSCRSPGNFSVVWNSQTPLLDLIQFGITFRILSLRWYGRSYHIFEWIPRQIGSIRFAHQHLVIAHNLLFYIVYNLPESCSEAKARIFLVNLLATVDV